MATSYPPNASAHVEAPPDGCPVCLQRHNWPHTSTLLDDGSVRGDYSCIKCGYQWRTTWNLEAL